MPTTAADHLPLLAAGHRDGPCGVPRVMATQLLLRHHYVTLRADGAFGPQTRAAVMAFQVHARLPASGMLRGQDWTELLLRATARIGCRGNEVRALQTLLNHHGEAGEQLVVDGVFGTATTMRLRFEHHRRGLPMTATADRNTYGALLHG
ncbi:peptidoglycan-binding domain-containing protein [Dermacoccaceae bacterium W4C1]